MFVGLEAHRSLFEELAKNGKLFSNYLFFGEPQVGKRYFAESLAHYLERGDFADSSGSLIDALIISPSAQEPYGIEVVRKAKKFLWQTPISSQRRTVIFVEAEKLTPEAQNALLKITEEPPRSALIILIASDENLILPTLLSRLIKVYFPRLPSNLIKEALVDGYGLEKSLAAEIADKSFGRMGRAIELTAIAKDSAKADDIDNFLEKWYLLLRSDIIKNSGKLAWLLNRQSLLSRYNLNRNLQFKTIKKFLTKKD